MKCRAQIVLVRLTICEVRFDHSGPKVSRFPKLFDQRHAAYLDVRRTLVALAAQSKGPAPRT